MQKTLILTAFITTEDTGGCHLTAFSVSIDAKVVTVTTIFVILKSKQREVSSSLLPQQFQISLHQAPKSNTFVDKGQPSSNPGSQPLCPTFAHTDSLYHMQNIQGNT